MVLAAPAAEVALVLEPVVIEPPVVIAAVAEVMDEAIEEAMEDDIIEDIIEEDIIEDIMEEDMPEEELLELLLALT